MFIFPYIPMISQNSTPSYIRLLHASPDAPPVDIYASDMLLAKNLTYKDFTQYLPVQPGEYTIKVFPTGKRINPVLTKKLEIPPRTISTIAAKGLLHNLALLPILDPKSQMIPGKTMVRVVHLSPDAPNVDVTLPDGTVLFRDVAYQEVEKYIAIDPGQYEIQIRVTGTNNIVLRVPNIRFYPNRFYTVYAVGLAEGKPPLQALIPLDGNSYINM